MQVAHKTELGLIALVTGFAILFQRHLPDQMESGYFILTLGLLFLFQTLLRDLWLLSRQRKILRSSMKAAKCMCLESGIAFVPVIASALLIIGGFSQIISIPPFVWLITIPTILLFDFRLKDYVFEWNPFRIRRDPDHVNILFSRK
ncbi:MAG: hypothetical protein V3V05_09200 [Pontiella sp.]